MRGTDRTVRPDREEEATCARVSERGPATAIVRSNPRSRFVAAGRLVVGAVEANGERTVGRAKDEQAASRSRAARCLVVSRR